MLKWEKLPGLETGRAGHTATLAGHKIYVFGGRLNGSFYNDLWSFDTQSQQWKLLQEHAPFPGRAYHTATLVAGKEIWIVGGSDEYKMYHDVHVLKLDKLEWTTPTLRGQCLARGTHAATLHPTIPNTILIYGGYGGPIGTPATWLSDLLILRTDLLEWEQLHPAGECPTARGYHSFTTMGRRAVLFGGKDGVGTIKEKPLWVYDPADNKWILPPTTAAGPSPRSNHGTALVQDNAMVVYGGRQGMTRVNDFFILQISDTFLFKWKQYEFQKSPYTKLGSKRQKNGSSSPPEGRAAHCVVAHKDTLYIIAGYGGQKRTFADCYLLHLPSQGSALKTPKAPKTPFRPLIREIDGWISTKKQKEVAPEASSCSSGVPDPYEYIPDDDPVDKVVPSVRPCSSKRKSPGESSTAKEMEFLRTENSRLELELDTMKTVLKGVCTERDGLQRTVASLQIEVEARKNEIQNGHAAKESIQHAVITLQRQLEAGKKELHNARSQRDTLQETVASLQQQLEVGRSAQANASGLQRQVDSLKSDLHRARRELQEKMDLREREKQDLQRRAQQELERSMEHLKGLHEDAVLERDEYKCCVQKLEAELQKQMQTLQQAKTNYESERGILLQEIAERKGTADRIFMELGTSKEALRSTQENVQRLTKQIEITNEKFDRQQREKEELSRQNGVLSADNKQIATAKKETESSFHLVKMELESARTFLEQNAVELKKLKDRCEEDAAHIATLRSSLKTTQEQYTNTLDETARLRTIVRSAEEFEKTQLRLLQGHVEKLQGCR